MTDLGPVRLVVADDHAIWRSGLRSELGSNFHVVAEAADARIDHGDLTALLYLQGYARDAFVD